MNNNNLKDIVFVVFPISSFHFKLSIEITNICYASMGSSSIILHRVVYDAFCHHFTICF